MGTREAYCTGQVLLAQCAKLSSLFNTPGSGGTVYAVLRIAFGLDCLIYLATIYPFLSLFYSEQGLCTYDTNAHTFFWNQLGQFSFFYLSDSLTTVRLVFFAALLNSLLFTIGYKIRLTSILQYLFISTFFLSPCPHDNYGDYIFMGTCFLMMFIPSKHPLSLDRRLSQENTPSCFSPCLYKTLMLYLCTLYLTPMFYRIAAESWWDGSAIWIALVDPLNSRVSALLEAGTLTLPAMLLKLVCYASLLYELLFPILIWIKGLRVLLVVIGISFHFGMALVLDLGLFPVHMGVLLLACLGGVNHDQS